MSNTDVKAPRPSPREEELASEQSALLREQRDILAQSRREERVLAPILFGQAGVTPQFSDKGEIIGFTEDPTQKAIREGLSGRTLAALRGELPLNPIIGRELGTQEQTLREMLRKQLGPGWETSSPGIEAMRKFGESRAGILQSASEGQLSTGEALGLARQQAMLDALQRAAQPPLTLAQLFGQAASGYNAPQALGLQTRQLGLQRTIAQRQLDLAKTGMILDNSVGVLKSFLGGGGGQGIGMALASSAKFKEDIQPLDPDEYRAALRKVRETPITTWRYKGDTRQHIGPIVETSPKEITDGDSHIVLGDWLGVVHAGVKGLDRDVAGIKRDVRTLREALHA